MFEKNASLKYINEIIKKSINDINTMFPAIVDSYNVETGLITVLPKSRMLDNDGNYIERALLFECPTSYIKAQSFYLRIPYQKGDIVYVGCSQESLDNLLIDSNTVANSLDGVSKFRLTDAVVIGGLMTSNEKLMTKEFGKDFVIQNRKNDDIIVLKEDGGVYVKTATKFQIDANDVVINSKTMTMNVDDTTTNGNTITDNVSIMNVSGDATIGTVTSGKGISLDNHTHQYTAPSHPSGPANTTPSQ